MVNPSLLRQKCTCGFHKYSLLFFRRYGSVTVSWRFRIISKVAVISALNCYKPCVSNIAVALTIVFVRRQHIRKFLAILLAVAIDHTALY